MRTHQAVPHIGAVLHRRLQRDPAQVQEHGRQELRVSLASSGNC